MTYAPRTALSVQASARKTGSVSRQLTDAFVTSFAAAGHQIDVVERDLSEGVPLVDETWVAANFTPPAERSGEQACALSYSDRLIDEVRAADLLLIGAPMYNFSVPAALKAWIDQIARVGETFRYTETGPEGLLKDKRAFVFVATGGAPIGSALDHATPYLRHILGFVGIDDVAIVGADGVMAERDRAVAAALEEIEALAKKHAPNAA